LTRPTQSRRGFSENKRSTDKRCIIAAELKPEELSHLDYLAESHNTTRSTVIRYLLNRATPVMDVHSNELYRLLNENEEDDGFATWLELSRFSKHKRIEEQTEKALSDLSRIVERMNNKTN
jgi:hypothetical protein